MKWLRNWWNKRHQNKLDKLQLAAEAECQRVYEMLQEAGIEVYSANVHIVNDSDYEGLHDIVIKVSAEKRYELRQVYVGKKIEQWQFTEDNSCRNLTLEEALKVMTKPCRRYVKKMHHWRLQWLKQHDYQEYVRLIYR